MGFILKLQHGSSEIDLNADPYFVAQGWAPPAAIIDPLFSTGNMGNTFVGGELIEKRYLDNATTVPLIIRGATAAETHGATRKLISFIQRALSDKSQTLYLVYNPSDAIPYAPKWGQSHLYWEIKDASAALRRLNDYLTTNVRDKVVFNNLSFVLAPLPVGISQTVGMAKGGLIEHTWATPDRSSRGLHIPPATTNKMTNPVYGYSTYDNGWSIGASATKEEMTDPEFVAHGTSSLLYTRRASTAWTLYQSINVGNTNTHVLTCYAKKLDKSAVTASDATLWYGTTQTTTYTAVGDGWYRLSASFSGVSAATNVGIVGNAVGVSFVVDGWQLEEKSVATPLAYGDLPGCAWTGTAHASTSTRTAATWCLPGVLEEQEFSVEFVWTPDYANTALAADIMLLDTEDGSSGLRLYFQQASNTFRFSDGTNTISSSATTFAAGQINVMCVVAERGSLKIYRNGAQIATGSTYTPPAAPDYLYLGSAAAGAHAGGYFSDLTIWHIGLTTAQILAHYTDLYQHLSGGDGYGQELQPIPWHWTVDGDNVYDGCDDSTHKNWGLIGGIPGNAPAETFIDLSMAAIVLQTDILLATMPYYQVRKHADLFFNDISGTADASDCGGEHRAIPTPFASRTGLATYTAANPDVFDGRTVHFYIRLKHSSTAGDVVAGRWIQYNNGFLQDEDVTVTVATSYRLFYLGPLRLSFIKNMARRISYSIQPQVNLDSSIASGNLWIDFYAAFAGKRMYINWIANDIPGGGAGTFPGTTVYINASEGQALFNTAYSTPDIGGDNIELEPNRANMLVLYYGTDAASAHSLTPAITANISIIPRYTLL